MSEKFCLKWNDFHSNISKSFSKLRFEDDFFDVTLVSDDQKQISAHKVVLSASSEYFQNILKQNKHSNPLLCLEGVSSSELNNILDYVYHGEVKIYQDDLDRFLSIAERFQLEGLMSKLNTWRHEDAEKFTLNDINEIEHDDSYFEEKTDVSSSNMKVEVISDKFANIDELDAKILEHIERDGCRWKCNICDKILRVKAHAKEHVEIHFDGLSFPCSNCNAILRSRTSLRLHRRKHKLN